MRREEEIQEFCIKSHKTLSLAESCTGGALAAKLTLIPSASEYFKGSLVAYSNDVKEKVLGVRRDTLLRYGALSEEVVREMAFSAASLFNTDYAIATSGIAGPTGGTEEKPVGTVWAAISDNQGCCYAWKFYKEGDRMSIITYSVEEVLEVFWQKICKQ